MDGQLKIYQMNLEGEIDAAKIAEISRVVGQLIKGEMYGLILNFEAVEHINFAVLPSLVEEKGGCRPLAEISVLPLFPTTSRIFSRPPAFWRSFKCMTASSKLPRALACRRTRSQRTCR